VRAHAKQRRASAVDTAAGFDELAAELAGMPVADALPLARAFAHFLNLANIAEQQHRVRRRRAYQRDPRRGRSRRRSKRRFRASWPAGWPRRPAPTIANRRIELVVTAHPTEIMRRTLQQSTRASRRRWPTSITAGRDARRARSADRRRSAARSRRPGRRTTCGASGRHRSRKCGQR
jgi:phosphoenolpyruvate carboxylase